MGKADHLGSGNQVTLAITTFDRPDYLEECLASVRHQTLTRFGLAVLDNASTADYSGALDRFRDLPMSYVRNETNIGAAGNIGRAMREYSNSEYLVVFHDDDMMHPRMLEWQLEVLNSNPEIQFVSTELAVFDNGNAPPREVWGTSSPEIEIFDDVSDLARSLLGGRVLCFGSTMYRASVLKRIELDLPRFGIIWDRPFLLDAARLGKAALIRAPLVLYRRHPQQDTNTGPLSAENLIELMKAYREALPANWNRADQQLFYKEARNFLVRYGYSHLAPEKRIGAAPFIRECVQNKVLRFRDIGPRGLATLMRADIKDALPSSMLDAVRTAKRRVSRRRAVRVQKSPSMRGQARPPQE